jgi:hypothetical protein
MNEYSSLAEAAKMIAIGNMDSFMAPSLANNGIDFTVDRHDIYRNDESDLIVFRRYSNKALNLTEYRL